MIDQSLQQFEPVEAFNITIDGKTTNTTSLSDQVTNSVHAKSMMIYTKIKPASSVNGETVRFYLVRDDQHPTSAYRSEGVGTAAVSPSVVGVTNAEFIGSVTFDGTADAQYADFIVENIGPKFSIIMEFLTTGTISSAVGNFARYRLIT